MCSLEERGTAFSELGYNEVVAEGADVARELATLALLRSQLPGAAAALSAALVRPPPAVAKPLQHINQVKPWKYLLASFRMRPSVYEQ